MAKNMKYIILFLFILNFISTDSLIKKIKFLKDKEYKKNKITIVGKLLKNKIFQNKKNNAESQPTIDIDDVDVPLKSTDNSKLSNDLQSEKPLYIQDNLLESSSVQSLSEKIFNVKCFWVHDYEIYSLQKLSTKKGYEIKNGTDVVAKFSLCENLENTDTTFLFNGEEVAGSIDECSEWKEYKEGGSRYLNITLPKKKEKDYEVTLNFECDDSSDTEDDEKKFKKNLVLEVEDKENPKKITVKSKTIYACPLNNYYLFERLFNKYKVPSVIVICAMGMFLAFFGAKIIKVTILLIAALAFTVIALSTIYGVFTISNENTMLIIMVVAFCIGLALGCLLLKMVKLFIVILGGAIGYTLGTVVYAIVKDKELNIREDYLYYGTLAICVLLCALIALCLVKHVLIWGTSIVGGFLIIKGASFILGHFPSESMVIDLIKNKEYEQLDDLLADDYAFYYYGVWLLIVIVGICVQYRNSDSKDKKKDKLLK
jgi:hypothetical protein